MYINIVSWFYYFSWIDITLSHSLENMPVLAPLTIPGRCIIPWCKVQGFLLPLWNVRWFDLFVDLLWSDEPPSFERLCHYIVFHLYFGILFWIPLAIIGSCPDLAGISGIRGFCGSHGDILVIVFESYLSHSLIYIFRQFGFLLLFIFIMLRWLG